MAGRARQQGNGAGRWGQGRHRYLGLVEVYFGGGPADGFEPLFLNQSEGIQFFGPVGALLGCLGGDLTQDQSKEMSQPGFEVCEVGVRDQEAAVRDAKLDIAVACLGEAAAGVDSVKQIDFPGLGPAGEDSWDDVARGAPGRAQVMR